VASPDETSRLRHEITHLRLALATLDAIGQAKGILMERHGIAAEEAFQRLVAMSQNSNIKLHDVAQNLVELRADLPASDPSVG
jgi:AmiR/NasT family two-component response regulator